MDTILKKIVEGTATETGEGFFSALVKNLALALDVPAAWVTENVDESRRFLILAFWLDGKLTENEELKPEGTPCEAVLLEGRMVHVPENIEEVFPNDPDLEPLGIKSYVGVPFNDKDGHVLGHLAVFDRRPMLESEEKLAIIRIFAARAASELRRIRAEALVREREEKLSRLLNTAPDAIVELDTDLNVTLLNSVAEKALQVKAKEILGRHFSDFLSQDTFPHLRNLTRELSTVKKGATHRWVPEILTAVCADGSTFPAEATLSRSGNRGRISFTLILRNINDRLAAEEKIRTLSIETAHLREEIRALGNFDNIIGTSIPLMKVLKDVDQVAPTDATVLIHGETGTGKELIAWAIHEASQKREHSLVTVNCAAIPAGLMESEFFGHEKGAFTGATQKRVGRFALADGGTIFLDEVAELPADLQAKLLRVLQEGEYEPVGSSRTLKVNVRVIAATNRDLQKAVDEGSFRQDLYYRLNVFPIQLPPLRERGDDVVLLSRAFVEKLTRQLGRTITPLSQQDINRLKSYPWPGNVRELQNVIERAVITARDGRLNLDRALPETAQGSENPQASDASSDDIPIRTAAQMQALERENLIRALQATDWRISGKDGAAKLLGLAPSTLNSRIKALGLTRSH
ncbi:MAG: sigma 54-interacting transcriptional regulator [Desulfobacteraceae bacterium]|jgi:PAS domain S-box-containing protein|nr:sigma 54-interacting transcriptional regulator [Desulfobacteraceae bacterium]